MIYSNQELATVLLHVPCSFFVHKLYKIFYCFTYHFSWLQIVTDSFPYSMFCPTLNQNITSHHMDFYIQILYQTNVL